MNSYCDIVIGAGSAGCVVATRLSEDPNRRVLLIEAGGTNRRPDVVIPAAFPNQFHTRVDWDYTCEPEEGLAGRGLYEPRGRMLGGCSAGSPWPCSRTPSSSSPPPSNVRPTPPTMH